MKKLLLALLVSGASATALSEQLIMRCEKDNVYMLDTDKGQLFIRQQGQWKQKCNKKPWVRYDPGIKGDLRTDYSTEVKDKSFFCLWTHTGVKSNRPMGFDKWWYDFFIGEIGWSTNKVINHSKSCRLM